MYARAGQDVDGQQSSKAVTSPRSADPQQLSGSSRMPCVAQKAPHSVVGGVRLVGFDVSLHVIREALKALSPILGQHPQLGGKRLGVPQVSRPDAVPRRLSPPDDSALSSQPLRKFPPLHNLLV